MITVLQIVLPLILALISIFVITGYASSVKTHAGTISSLDEKKSTVMELTAATSAAASAAITVIPGDVATPIADKLADLSSYFLVVLSAIYLEKFLVTILGIAAFQEFGFLQHVLSLLQMLFSKVTDCAVLPSSWHFSAL